MKKSGKPDSKNRLLMLLTYGSLGLVAVLAFSLFLYFNKESRDAVQIERENYTSEIATQLTRNIDNLQNSYSNEIREGANIIASVQPKTLAEVAKMFPDRENAKHLLISQGRRVIGIDGAVYTIGDEFLPTKIANAGADEVILSNTSVNLNEDYLIFAKRITPLTIDGTAYVGMAVGVSSEQFRKNMTISLFNGVGAGYLISGDGAIFIKPDDESMVFAGYNLFSSLKAGGVSEAQIEKFKTEMTDNGESKARVTVNKIEWMIDIKSTQFSNDYLVVAVPLTLTAASTYSNMTLTVVFAFVFIVALAGIMILVIFNGSRRQREEDKKAASAAAQTNFLAKMSHDIRTPLNAVTGMLQLAGDPRHSRQEVDEYVAKATESANYLLELINGMLDLQKIGSGKMTIAHEPFSMAQLLDGIDSMYKPVVEGKGLRFVFVEEQPFPDDYYGDEIKVKQILMNLLSNAMKFTPKGGTVTLKSQRKPLDGQFEEVTLSVSDTGIGMSAEFMKHMFSPFEQEKSSTTSGYVGTGLGLNIVKSLTELMGGKVRVESALGEGSSFYVTLPFEKSPLAPSVSPQKPAIVPFNHQRVLLAEDNAINQQIAVLLLKERLQLEVDPVNNGKEAVDAFASSPAGKYVAILLDVRMPVMDGLEAARECRACAHPQAKSIPIIALSANTYEEDVRQSLQAGMNAHLAKPIDLAALAAKLHEYVK